MLRGLISLYLPSLPKNLVYMLQATEYQTGPYLKWFWRTKDFTKVARRRNLEYTKHAKLLLLLTYCGMVYQLGIGLTILVLGMSNSIVGGIQLGLAIIISYPVVWGHLIVIPLEIARIVIIKPKEKRLIKQSQTIFTNTKAVKIAVAGSYGKTTMKELLKTVIQEGKKVAATPGNKNVTASHAIFASKLDGDEEVLVIEYGEGKPGDVARFTNYTRPDIGVITGVAPAHLDQYKTLEAAARDIFELANYLGKDSVYVNGESAAAEQFIKPPFRSYGREGVDGWKVTNFKQSIGGVSFNLSKGKKQFKLHSQLLGEHQVGPLSCVAVIADGLGLNAGQIEKGVAETKPYEHRMSPYSIRGAWIIDDTYNGNLEGVQAGLKLLAGLEAKRKIYVTPGLVDQGSDSHKIHRLIGEMIAGSVPDKVVLMSNSETTYIEEGLNKAGFAGEIVIETDPLKFYTNIDQFVASGDLVLMQNDWTDNYK
jgi:UDP-N-acetylmuramoyl-tripeptide--D-alanyl-D-alanine ligase